MRPKDRLNEKSEASHHRFNCINTVPYKKSGSGAKIHKTEFIRNLNELLEYLSSNIVINIKVFIGICRDLQLKDLSS
jgi:hypothetical protein